MTTVFTTHGLVDRSQLELTPVISESPTAVEVALEWRLNGELVRRDLWVNVLRPPQMEMVNG